MQETLQITAREAVERLLAGNQKYIDAKCGIGDISKEIRQRTSQHGQAPYAIIVTCSDSRVIPENIFSAGIGELFVIRLMKVIALDPTIINPKSAANGEAARWYIKQLTVKPRLFPTVSLIEIMSEPLKPKISWNTVK